MECYRDFAYVYETFMDQTPYEEWCQGICDTLNSYGIEDGLVLDLACGTGTLTRMLRDRGYDMIGVDASEEMLEIAREHEYTDMDEEPEEGSMADILYLCQDMREFELYGTVRAIICSCDSINYLTERQDVEQVMKLVNNYLDPDGILLMDYNTPERYEAIGDSTIAENREDCSFIWENYYDEETHSNQYDLTIFLETEDGLYEKSEETHLQRGYTPGEIAECIAAGGLELIEDRPLEDGRRLIIARENGK